MTGAGCGTCLEYFTTRGGIVARAVVQIAIARDLLDHLDAIARGYAHGVHTRHLAGENLEVST